MKPKNKNTEYFNNKIITPIQQECTGITAKPLLQLCATRLTLGSKDIFYVYCSRWYVICGTQSYEIILHMAILYPIMYILVYINHIQLLCKYLRKSNSSSGTRYYILPVALDNSRIPGKRKENTFRTLHRFSLHVTLFLFLFFSFFLI